MEILAIVVLGVSALLGLSTSESKPQRKTNKRYDDADWAFTEAYDLNASKAEDYSGSRLHGVRPEAPGS